MMNWQARQIRMALILICVSSLSILLPKAALDVAVSSELIDHSDTQLTSQQLNQHALALTVKVLSNAELGSGFLIKKQGSVYTVLTNAHVLRAGDFPYYLQTPDGGIYSARLVETSQSQGNDLALLQFSSPKIYPVASLGSAFTLTPGQEVFAAGFTATGKFKFTSGRVSLILEQALEGGYQVGYTNEIVQGMSGGPLLNRRGEVVGINGQHAYPLWDAPSVFQDGSKAPPTLHKIINHLSFAVPIETVLQLAPISSD